MRGNDELKIILLFEVLERTQGVYDVISKSGLN